MLRSEMVIERIEQGAPWYRLGLIKTQNEKGPVTLNSREDLKGIHGYGAR